MLECDLTPAGDPQESQCRLAWMHQGRGERSLVWGMRNSSLCPASKSSMVTLAVARDDILAARHPGHASKHSHWMDPRFANYQGVRGTTASSDMDFPMLPTRTHSLSHSRGNLQQSIRLVSSLAIGVEALGTASSVLPCAHVANCKCVPPACATQQYRRQP
jgi:hypothetical protein